MLNVQPNGVAMGGAGSHEKAPHSHTWGTLRAY